MSCRRVKGVLCIVVVTFDIYLFVKIVDCSILFGQILRYSKISLLRSLKIKTTSLFRPTFASSKWDFFYNIIFDIKTISLIRPLLSSLKGGLNIGILLLYFWLSLPYYTKIFQHFI